MQVNIAELVVVVEKGDLIEQRVGHRHVDFPGEADHRRFGIEFGDDGHRQLATPVKNLDLRPEGKSTHGDPVLIEFADLQMVPS